MTVTNEELAAMLQVMNQLTRSASQGEQVHALYMEHIKAILAEQRKRFGATATPAEGAP